jgi:4-aminobutyrate aminotransferase
MELPHILTELPGPRAREVIERDRRVVSPSYTRRYPLVVRQGQGAIVEDVDGNRFLDFTAGIAVVATGHCHPKVVEAIQLQSARLIHMSGTDFYYEGMADLAEKIASLAPGGGAWKVYFGNSGTEAVEAAIKLARYATGREKFISFFGGFHGRTLGSLSLTASRQIQKKGFGTLLPGVYHAPYAYPYRLGKSPAECAADALHYIEDTLFRMVLPPGEVAAIIVEPIQGESGYVVPPREFLRGLRGIADRHGILLIADEVQSGVGRTGRWWACEHFDVIPDIFTVAKGIASGMPLSATVAKAELMQWKPGAHASTFGGNPISIAAALATINLVGGDLPQTDLLQTGFMANAARRGEWLMNRFRTWPERFRLIGEVRGLGLMIGIEIVKDRQSRGRAPELRDRIGDLAFERGLVVLGAGESSLRLSPPLCITEQQAQFAADTLEECLEITSRT